MKNALCGGITDIRDAWIVATRRLSFAATWMNRRLLVEVILACNRLKKNAAGKHSASSPLYLPKTLTDQRPLTVQEFVRKNAAIFTELAKAA
jgi:hypothetical protein